MAIITFCSNETKETGQTLSVAAISTYMAIEHNYKILIVSTNFNDLSLENCFWEYEKIRPTGALKEGSNTVGLESGVEGLIKVLTSNRTSDGIIKSYSRTIFKDSRLDILLSPATKSYQEYTKITPYYKDILSIANKCYDLVFVDLSKKMPKQDVTDILQTSDIVVMNLTQRLKTINDFIELRNANEFYKKRNVMLAIGRYDQFSKYNSKNITRYLKEKRGLCVIPYNTLFFEACSEGNITDFIANARSLKDETDRNANFIKEIKAADVNIVAKLQELQMRL